MLIFYCLNGYAIKITANWQHSINHNCIYYIKAKVKACTSRTLHCIKMTNVYPKTKDYALLYIQVEIPTASW